MSFVSLYYMHSTKVFRCRWAAKRFFLSQTDQKQINRVKAVLLKDYALTAQDLGQNKPEQNEKKIISDTETKLDHEKSNDTDVQIFKNHFDPFWTICSRKVFCKIIFIIFFQTSSRLVLSGSNDRNYFFVLFLQYFNVQCFKKCALSKIVFVLQ